MLNTNNRLGNPSIAKQQGTTRILYDSLPLDGSGEYRFFEEAQTRRFPFTNKSQSGNTLGVGETIAVERAYLSVFAVDPETAVITEVTTLAGSLIPALTLGELSLDIANQQVAKQMSLQSFDPRFNKSSASDINQNFEFDTNLIIPPLIEFVFRARMPVHGALANHFIRLTIEGAGAILAPRQTL